MFNKQFSKKIFYFFIFPIVTLSIIFIGNYFVYAWTEPTANPPNGGITISGMPAGAANQTVRYDSATSKWIGDGTLINNGTNIAIGGVIIANDRLNVVAPGAGLTSAQFTDNVNSGLRVMHPSSNILRLEVDSANDIIFGDNSPKERMRITSGGNVGIGIVNPGTKLEIVDNSNDAMIAVRGNMEGPFGSGASIVIDNTDPSGNGGPSALRLMRGGSTRWAWVNDVDGNATDNLTLWEAGNLKPLVVTSGGNVGIGKASANSTLDVNGTIRGQQICDENGANCQDLTTLGTGSSITPGTLCGVNPAWDPNVILCNGHNPRIDCPAGYSQGTFGEPSHTNLWYTCVKN